MPTRPQLPRVLLTAVSLAACAAAAWFLWPEGAPADHDATGSPTPGGITWAPLRAAEGGETPRFRRLPASVSGLAFANELRKENRYQYLTNGAGLAAGDYDGDGLCDLYLVSQDGPNKLFRQTAPLRFHDVTTAAGGIDGGDAWGTGACFADVDGDGDLDLYVCNMESPNLLYLNQGDGTFREGAKALGLDVAAASVMAAFADTDRDGDLDLYLLTNRALHASWAQTPEVLREFRAPATARRKPDQMVPSLADLEELGRLQRTGAFADGGAGVPERLRHHFFAFHGQAYMAGEPDRFLRNDSDRAGGGKFVDATAAAGFRDFGMGLSATFWDYDDDGWPDLYVANDLESPDALWRNQRDGTFRDVTAEVLPHTAYYGMGSDAGDVDGDGRLDFFVGDMSATTHRMAKILMGDMTRQRDFLIHARPQQYMRNALYVNTGTGRFQEAAFLAKVASTDWTWSTLFGDLDNDARLDLFATNGIARFDMDPDLLDRVKRLYEAGRYDAMVDEIKTVGSVPEKNLALRNAGDLEFAKTGEQWGLDRVAITHGAVLVDLDRDGDLDVVTNDYLEECGLFENRTAGANAAAVELRSASANRFGVGARVTATANGAPIVREAFPARGYLSGQEPRLHFGLGAATTFDLRVRWPSGHVQEFRDLPAGRLYTVAEPDGTPPPVQAARPQATAMQPAEAPPFAHRETPFDEFTDQFLLPSILSQLGPGIAFGNADAGADGDGGDDVFIGGAAGQSGALFVRDGERWREVEGPWRAHADREDMGVLWLDHDGDGDQDLFVVSGGVEAKEGDERLRDRLYRNDGGLRFVHDEAALPDLRESGSCACAADFDRDGDLDLFVGSRVTPGSYPDAPPSRLLRNDDGRFTDVTAAVAPALLHAGMVSGAVWSDADGDGLVDLLVAAHWQPIRLLKNGGAWLADVTEAAGLAAHTGWWNSLCPIDADADGDMDYVAGNQGLNTKYKASPEHPAGLLAADFDGNGTRDLVETKYEGDRLLPVRGRSCSSVAMPFLAERFPTYEKFASSVLEEIYPRDRLREASKLQATTLASSLLRNDGSGRFTIEPLPRRAQLAPLFGIAPLGADTLALAENSYAPEPETGRHDGGIGLVLAAQDGGLAVVPNALHGISFFGDGKGLAAGADGAGGIVLAYACNDAPLRCWTQPGAGRQVALPAAKGNPTCVGARVVLEYPGGGRRAVDVTAGQGYLSQSAPRVFAGGAVRAHVTLPNGERTVVELQR